MDNQEKGLGPNGKGITAKRVREFMDQPKYVHDILVHHRGFSSLYPGIEDELLIGGIDTHTHVSPDFVVRGENIIDYAIKALHAGMSGIVMKNHYHMTAHMAEIAQRYMDDYIRQNELTGRIEIFGDICLTLGLNVESVRIAARYKRLKLIRMPTFNSKANRLAEGLEGGISIIDAKGNICSEIEEILKIAKNNKISISSGHISPEENIALSAKAQEMGIPYFVNHAISEERPYGMDIKRLRQCADNGAFIGLDVMHMIPSFYAPATDPQITIDVLEAIGADRCILVSDVGQVLNWDPLGGLRIMIRALLGYGVSGEDIKKMFVENPSKLICLD